jgi:predicted nucleotidyltransferase
MIREGKKLPVDVTARIPALIAEIGRDPAIAALHAFGSLVDGRLKPLSDLDFAVLLSNAIDKRQRLDKRMELIGIFSDILGTDEVDLVILNDDPLRFSYGILKSGNLLYCRDKNQLIDFTEKTVKRYLDFAPVRRQFDRVFLEGIGYHGF